MNKAYKYRLYPNDEQKILLAKTFGCCRFIYNKMLADKKAYYEENHKKLNNTPAQYKEEFEWLKEVDSLALANVQMQLQTAFNNFFRNQNIGYPKFKSKKNDKKTYTTNHISIKNHFYLKLPKLGLVKFVEHRRIPKNYTIKSAAISQTGSGKYYISILTEYEYTAPTPNLSKDKSIGLDYSSPCFYIDNQGAKAGYPKFYRKYQDKLAREQKKLSNMELHSHNYEKQKIAVYKIHEKIANCRKNFTQELSTRLLQKYDYICIEDLDMKALSQSLRLGKSTMDNGWGMFRNQLQYKAGLLGKKIIKTDKWYPSSKTCNHCGFINKELKLSDREWICPNCGAIIARDENAAKNILEVGLSLV